jgi:hypothetical protein
VIPLRASPLRRQGPALCRGRIEAPLWRPEKKEEPIMKTYTVLFAEDVPHYGAAQIEAENDAAAVEAAKAFDLSDVTDDPAWEYSVCRRIVNIEDTDGEIIAEEISLDDCFLRYGGEKDRLLCDVAPELLDALETAEEQLSRYCIGDDGRDAEPHQALKKVRDAIAKAKRGAQ